MPTAEAVLAFFRRHNGLGESPPNSNCNWITAWYGMGCAPWCAMTVSRSAGEAGFGNVEDVRYPGVERTTRKGHAYVPYVRNDFRAAGRWITDRYAGWPGDFVLFDWTGDGVGDHIGVVERYLGVGEYLTWEGNTGGNRLEQRRRPISTIMGFARPPYDTAGPTPPQEDPEVFRPAWRPNPQTACVHIVSCLGGLLVGAAAEGFDGSPLETFPADGGRDTRFLHWGHSDGTQSFVSLKPQNDGRGLLSVDTPGGSAQPGERLHLWPFNGLPAQRFGVEWIEGTRCLVRHVDSGLYFDIKDSNRGAGAHLILSPKHGGVSQQFVFAPTV